MVEDGGLSLLLSEINSFLQLQTLVHFFVVYHAPSYLCVVVSCGGLEENDEKLWWFGMKVLWVCRIDVLLFMKKGVGGVR